MSEALAQLFIEQRIASASAVQEALERQILLGGSLDTNILEADIASEAEVLRAIGEAFGMPTADRSDIDGIGSHIPRLFPLVFAETYHLVPYRLIGQNLGVLVCGPADRQLYERIHERLQLHVQPTVTTEVRMRYAMYRLYGAELLPRYRTLLEKLDGVVLAPAPGAKPGHVLSWGLAGPTLTMKSGGPRRRPPAVDVTAMLARLAAATDRDTIVDVLLEVTLSTFEYAAIFLVQGDQINGWRSIDAEATQRVAMLSLPVEMPSVFQTIYATHGHYLGPLPSNSVNLKLLEDLGRQPPRTALLAPILVGGKLAAIIYGDNGASGVPSKRVASILLLTHRAGMCLQGLIQRRKAMAVAKPAAEPAAEEPVVLVDDRDFEPLLDAEPPPPPEVAAANGEAAEEDKEADEAAAGESALWESVQLDHLDDVGATGKDGALLPATESAHDVAPAVGQAKPTYVAFADVDDETPEETVSEWEDVFIETVGTDRVERAVQEPRDLSDEPAPPAVTWEDVIAEAEAAPDPSVATPASIDVAGTQVDEREILLDSLTSTDPEVWKSTIPKLLELGGALDEIVTERFPGDVRFDPFAPHIDLPPFSRCTGITALLTALGTSAVPIVLPHLESDNRTKRFFAIYFLYAVRYPAALELLARRIYDSEPRNRYLAADALRTYRSEAAYRRIVQSLRDHLKVPVVEAQVATVQVLGQLRDPSSVPSLIPLVVSPRQALARASTSALTVICAQAFGANVAQWAEWWQTHFNKPREAWLVEGMRHADPGIRRIAAREFQLLTGRCSPATSSASAEPADARPPA